LESVIIRTHVEQIYNYSMTIQLFFREFVLFIRLYFSYTVILIFK